MGLRSGDEYLAGLKDDREIWYDGAKIESVTEDRLAWPAKYRA